MTGRLKQPERAGLISVAKKKRENQMPMEEKDVIDLYCRLKNLPINIWIDGGWGVDALLGRQTRTHKDLDVTIQQKDIPSFLHLLEGKGHKEIKLDIARPHNFVLADDCGREIDVHVVVLTDDGDGIYGPVENGEMYPAASLTANGKIGNIEVNCISPAYVVKSNRCYRSRAIKISVFSLLQRAIV